MADSHSNHFNGGLALPEHKELSTRMPVVRAPLPERLILPLQQHIGNPSKPIVAVGDRVAKGQCIAQADGYISAALHAPTSGRVSAMEHRPIPHPSGSSGLCIILESDGEDAWGELPPPCTDAMPDAFELRRRIRDAGVVGLGGAAFPTAVKLNPGPDRSLELLLLNGAECEPYISCDDMLMREKANEIIAGATSISRALEIPRCAVGVEDNKTEALEALKKAIAETPNCEIRIHPVPTRYPAGGEKQLIQVVTGREVPGNGMPADIGILCHNVGTVLAVQDALTRSRPLTSRYLTVTGGGIANPCNLEVLIGTPIRHLTEFCGGYLSDARRLILGGPMMGIALENDAVPIVKGSNCILVAGEEELAPASRPLPCIRCGDCVAVCPAQLLPQQLYWHARAQDFDAIQDYGLFDCIECGCCAAVCPSNIPLVHYYRFAKTEIWAQEQEHDKAEIARHRHQFQGERREQEDRERIEKTRKKRAALGLKVSTGDGNKNPMEVAVARIKARNTQQDAVPDRTGKHGPESLDGPSDSGEV